MASTDGKDMTRRPGHEDMLAQLVDAWAHYLRRGRHPAVQLAGLAAFLYLAACGGWALSVELPFGSEQAVLRFRGDGGGFRVRELGIGGDGDGLPCVGGRVVFSRSVRATGTDGW